MQKIGVLTIYDLTNYGNRLQNYATVAYLKKCGIESDTLIVDYKSFLLSIKTVIRYLRGCKPIKDYNYRQEDADFIVALDELQLKRYDSFKTFTYKYIPPVYTSCIGRMIPHKLKKYRAFLAGSDQIWNPTIGQAKDWSFMRFAAQTKRVAWVASFGVECIDTSNKQRLKTFLSEIPHLSVREDAGARIIKELTGRDAEVLIDPTLMLDASEWNKIAHRPKNVDCDKKYILTYFLGGRSDRINEELRKYKEKGYIVYNLLDCEQPDVFISGPAEFIYLFSHASLILTDSFHACIFSFIFDKPFLVFAREGKQNNMMSRIDTLLSKFDLQRKYVDSGLANDVFEHDYQKGKETLLIEQEKVRKYLEMAVRD